MDKVRFCTPHPIVSKHYLVAEIKVVVYLVGSKPTQLTCQIWLSTTLKISKNSTRYQGIEPSIMLIYCTKPNIPIHQCYTLETSILSICRHSAIFGQIANAQPCRSQFQIKWFDCFCTVKNTTKGLDGEAVQSTNNFQFLLKHQGQEYQILL